MTDWLRRKWYARFSSWMYSVYSVDWCVSMKTWEERTDLRRKCGANYYICVRYREGRGTAEEMVSQYMVQPNLKHLICREFQFLAGCGFDSWSWQSDRFIDNTPQKNMPPMARQSPWNSLLLVEKLSVADLFFICCRNVIYSMLTSMGLT